MTAPSLTQRRVDRLVDLVFLWPLPRSVRPNHLTAIRLVLVPVVFGLFHYGWAWQGLVVFVVGVCTDFMDGAMARRRDQITDLGIFIDPLADKLLVASALLATGGDRLVVQVILVSIGIELFVMVLGAIFWARRGRAVQPNVFGKIKMVLLSIGLSLFILGGVLEAGSLVDASVWILWAALVFAVLAGIGLVRSRDRLL
ncbi:MAG: CDP-alcohol phosphatidyltransferase family protein [Actinobacteria bacterium]|nr:CDP-alcohol phosphatidyltransferase family protein [Actinomycetota bacterium]